MKTFFLSIFLIITAVSYSSESAADSAYRAQDYNTAINLYTQLIANRQQSAPLYFNLGNAYFKNNELGKAIWAYQKAQKIDPKQKDVLFNLNFASDLTKDNIEQSDAGISLWMAKVFYGRSINFWAYLSFFTLLICSVLFYFFKVTKQKNKRGVLLVASFSVAIISVVCFAIAVAHHAHISNLSNGIIIDAVVQVKTAPTAEDAVAFELHEGAKFDLKETTTEWYRIEVQKNEGWIKKTEALLY